LGVPFPCGLTYARQHLCRVGRGPPIPPGAPCQPRRGGHKRQEDHAGGGAIAESW
jgi:hypothetical protein